MCGSTKEKDGHATPEGLSDAAEIRARECVVIGIFQAVLQHVIIVQSEVALFSKVCGNPAATARALASAQATAGIVGMFANQILGKLSDVVGRKPIFCLGPLVTMLSSALIVNWPSSLKVLMLTRVLKSVMITVSGSIMATASLNDLSQVLPSIGVRIQTWVGMAIIGGPILEGKLLKWSGGDHRAPYKCLGIIAAMQLFSYLFILPETLVWGKRKTMASFLQSLSSINPLACLKIFQSKNKTFKKLSAVAMLQSLTDGKVASDVNVMWCQTQLKWNASQIRNYNVTYGALLAFNSAVITQRLMTALSRYNNLRVINALFSLAGPLRATFHTGWAHYLGCVLQMFGANASGSHHVKQVGNHYAQSEGFGNGEYASYTFNLRTFAQSAGIYLLGYFYSKCTEYGVNPGLTWMLFDFLGAGLPQLLVMSMKEEDLEIHDEKLEAHAPAAAFSDRPILEPPFADFMQSRGIRMRFELAGPLDKPPLLFIPGATSDLRKDMSKGQLQTLSKNFRVLTCDLRNQGETTPMSLQHYVPLNTYVDDLIELLDHTFGANAPVHVVGWGLGSSIALMLARLHAQRVKKLVLVQGGYFKPQLSHIGALTPGAEHLFGKDWPWVKDQCSYESLGVDERCHRLLQHADVRRQDPIYRKEMSPSYKWLHRVYSRSENQTVMKNAAELGRGVLVQQTAAFAEGTDKVEEITVSTLIIHGQQDGMHATERAHELKDKMPNAQLVILDQGHVGVVVPASSTITAFLVNSQLGVDDFLEKEVPRAPAEIKLTKARILAMQDELVAGFRKPGFQEKLRKIFAEHSKDPLAQALGRQKLCQQPQMDVIQRYGFPATSAGWLESLMAVVQFQNEPEVAANEARAKSLLNPALEADTMTEKMKNQHVFGVAAKNANVKILDGDEEEFDYYALLREAAWAVMPSNIRREV